MIYELEAYNTDHRYNDVRWREYTASKAKAELFKRIPKIQFTDSGHGIVFSVQEHRGKRKPEIRQIREYVQTQLDVLKAADKTEKPKRASRKDLESLCHQLAQSCKDLLPGIDDYWATNNSGIISQAESHLQIAKKAGVIDG